MPSSQTDLGREKSLLRKQLAQLRGSLSDAEINQKSLSICHAALELILERGASTVLLFYPVRREPSLLPLLDMLWERSIKTAFPISVKQHTLLDFRYVRSADDLSVGAYGICEPREACERADVLSEHTVCLVPALAIDRHGKRLGYGKGYYDRFLKDFSGLSAGIVFSDFLVEKLPSEQTDVPVDMMITEGGVFLPYEKH